eukprot:11170404-Lingulodinium_polyedra.AAC.1
MCVNLFFALQGVGTGGPKDRDGGRVGPGREVGCLPAPGCAEPGPPDGQAHRDQEPGGHGKRAGPEA